MEVEWIKGEKKMLGERTRKIESFGSSGFNLVLQFGNLHLSFALQFCVRLASFSFSKIVFPISQMSFARYPCPAELVTTGFC